MSHSDSVDSKNNKGFPAGTRIVTDKGLVPIQDIKVGDMVLSRPEYGGKDAPTEYKRVSRAFCSGEDELIRLSCQLDSEYDDIDAPIYITFMASNHPIWDESLKDWAPASDIEIGTLLSSIDNQNNLRVLSVESIYKGYVDNDLLIRGCFQMSFGNDDAQELDMLIQFNLDNYLLDFNRYKNKYLALGNNVFKLDSLIKEKAIDYIYNSNKPEKLKVPVYNLEVKESHTYFVGEQGLWIHT